MGTNSQVLGAPTHVYLLQMDSNSLGSDEQVIPLQLLDNSVDYGPNQYLLPLSSNRGQEQLQVLIDQCQEPAKILGLVVDKNYQNTPNVLSVSNIQHHNVSIVGSGKTEELPMERSRKDGYIKPELNVTVEVNNLCKPDPDMIQNFVQISDRIVPPRALAVLPAVLQVQRRDIITTRRALPTRARFGPVQGIRHKLSQSEAVELVLNATSNMKPLFLVKDENNDICHIDTSDKDKSNWIGLIPLGNENSANVWLYEENHELYAITTEIIPSRKPLMIGYSKKYAEYYGLVGPTKDIEKVSHVQKSWWCYECQRSLPSLNMLQRHMDLYHKEDAQTSRRKYRCRHCKRTFSRLFTLRRHTSFHCPNKLDKRNNVINNDAEEPQLNLNASICSLDGKIPSDESFQNYSNGLDFSTNLFDTDRIPSLDISGNSRSDNDFSPYVIGYRDENGLANDFDFSTKTEHSNTPSKKKQTKPMEKILISCPYCNLIIVKDKRRQHIRECPNRRFECECKMVFPNKKKLAHHIFTRHSIENATEQHENDNSSAATNPQGCTPYKCDQCQHMFKRRGMLVNHLWRVHNTVSARVPLERRVRHYPCGICPKIYRAAAKRDRHINVHHPGEEKQRGKAVDGGTRVCEPAMCSACPRQYATRSKLLQHQRAHHPHLVPQRTNKNCIKTNSIT